MTEQEMRELDAWIAEHGFGWSHFEATRLGCVGRDAGGSLSIVPLYTEADFKLVKREIERRGWRWVSAASFDDPLRYAFHVIDNLTRKALSLKEARTEELAGCLAFKAAVEATNGESTPSS